MKQTNFSVCLSRFILSLLFATAMVQARAQLGRAEVQGIQGPATYAVGAAVPLPVAKGISILPGTLVKTGHGSALDLYFGPEVGTVRLLQNSIFFVESLEKNQTRLTLREGSMAGWNARVPASSEFQVKLPKGIAGIVQGKYRLDSASRLVLLDGHLVYAHILNRQPTPYVLKTPPAVYFSPIEGVRAAPKPLQIEVETQTRGKLR